MFKSEIICPSCDEQFIIVGKNEELSYCTYCGDPIESEDQRGELEMGDSGDA